MKIRNGLALSTLAFALLGTAVAGEKMKGDYKCDQPAQECLDKMATNLKTRGWLGIEMDESKSTGAMSVTKVIDMSPAAAAGFKSGDVLAALNGIAMNEANEAKVREVWQAMSAGSKATYTVTRDGKPVELAVTLGAVPEDVIAQWVGKHMLEHAKPVQQAKK